MEISKSRLFTGTARSPFAQLRTPQRNSQMSMNTKTHFCPRCKQERLKAWFGDPKAPYAICLSCRVEVNGEKKQKAAEVLIKRASCAICARLLDEHDHDLCVRCEAGLNHFQRSHKLLARAASYLLGNLRKPKKRHVKGRRRRNEKLQQLIQEQARDDTERGLRFEHAISK